MSKIRVKLENLNNLLDAIAMSADEEFCYLCPNIKIDCPFRTGTVSKNRCQEALYKYLHGEEDGKIH